MKFWPEIRGAQEAFDAVGVRHGLRLRAGGVYSPEYFEGGAAVQVEVVTDDLDLVMLHAVPVAQGAAWIAALTDVLDVPEGLLPPPSTWVATTALVVAHDLELRALPTAGV
ncbi:hypothetical protein AB0L40_21380 [Patulibacter sp. NPDC049589]|uniref:hypothetical protein n=1 Tax=Patulibacter sp. NPDC049589 TaxID=3154731 RepID=UPI0034287622